MRRLFGSMTVVALVAMLAGGCGSTGNDPSGDGDDRLIFHFVNWDNTGITESDAISQSSADVDVVQDFCQSSTDTTGQSTITLEPFTQTVVNAVFYNGHGEDISLDHYVVHVGDPRSGLGDITLALSGQIIGGRCGSSGGGTGTTTGGTSGSTETPCSIDADCLAGMTAGTTSTCQFSTTTINGILLFDFLAKAGVNPQVFGEALPVTVTFYAFDANNEYRTTANYVVTFADYCNCSSGESCVL